VLETNVIRIYFFIKVCTSGGNSFYFNGTTSRT